MKWDESNFSHDLIYDVITTGIFASDLLILENFSLGMAIIKIQKVFMKKLVVLFTLLHFGVAGEPDDGILKSETKLAIDSSAKAKISSQLNDSSARRYHYISNRDSYVNAANSFSNGGGGQMSFSQNSYDAPMQHQGGYGWTDLGKLTTNQLNFILCTSN